MISDETRRKMSDSAKKRAARGILPNNKGKVAWNKGKTAEDDSRIKQYRDKQRGQKRIGNYVSNGCWKGAGNPWYDKKRNGELSPRYNPDRHKREYWDFYNRVIWASEKVYRANCEEINPSHYSRTLCGVEGGYQLDHIIPIHYGWEHDLTIEELSKKENLQMLPWELNREKWNKTESLT